MTQVISVPNNSDKSFRIAQDALVKLATSLRLSRVLINRCSDGPNKTCLLKQHNFLEELLEVAKAEVHKLAA